MTVPGIPDLVRPSFFDGQRLDADDLSAMYDFHRELRWLHNRSLHSWGVAVGFAVSGAKGGKEITVSPGYGLDCEGHDLVLSRRVSMQVPAVAGAAAGGPALYYLTASHLSDTDLAPSETRDGVCLPGGTVRRVETPRIRWQNPTDLTVSENRFRRGLDVVLASALVQDCALAAIPSTAERRDARPASQPYVAAGSTSAGKTPWQFFPSSGQIVGVQTRVDTSVAGFGRTPAYCAHVVGNRSLAANGPLVDGFVTVVEPTATSFLLQLTMPRNLSVGVLQLNPTSVFTIATLGKLQTALAWSVWWVGVEG
jgi:hypothetical protein